MINVGAWYNMGILDKLWSFLKLLASVRVEVHEEGQLVHGEGPSPGLGNIIDPSRPPPPPKPIPVVAPIPTNIDSDIDSRERHTVYAKAVSNKVRVRLSQDFYEDEFECQCGKCDSSGKMSRALIAKLQALRTAFGRPIRITSGYRCLEHNKAVGGAPNSNHLKGLAVDIAMTSSVDRYKLLKLAIAAEFSGVGVAKSFIHLDLRTSGEFVWTYEAGD